MAKKKLTKKHRIYNRLYMREYRKTHRDKIKAYKAIWRERHGIKKREKLQIEDKRRKRQIATKKWRKRNPEKWALIQSSNNHRRRSAKGRWSSSQLKEKFSYYGNKCFYCGGTGKLTVDHFIPLAKKPLNWLSNIRPACFPCNLKKGFK